MQKPLLDTNIVLSGREKSGFICYPVLKELDHMKTYNDSLGKNARDRIYEIYSNPEAFPFIFKEQSVGETVDDFLIRLCLEDGYTLKTLDLSLHLKALQKKVDSIFNGGESEDYSGMTYLETEEEIADFYEEKLRLMGEGRDHYYADYPDNHYIIIGEKAYKVTNKTATEIEYHTTDNYYVGKIKPRNIEQYCLFDALHSDIPVVSATGKFGVGKENCPFV